VFSSTLKLWRSLFATYGYQQPNYDGLEEFVLSTFIHMHERLEATRAQVPAGQLSDVRYEDLARAPLETVCRLYESHKLGDFEQVRLAAEEYLTQRIGYQPQKHDLEPHWRDEVYRRWQPYFQKYCYE